MKQLIFTSVVLVIGLMCSRPVCAQGAVQAVRNAAQGLEGKVQNNQLPLTAGPVDNKERIAPGKIDSDVQREFKSTRSGLKYRVLRNSNGPKPKETDSVEVHYKGWLDDKSIFDSSYRNGETTSFALNRVIQGWTEGVQLIGKGGMIELEIPPELGYRDKGTRGIPPKATLHFVVELITIK